MWRRPTYLAVMLAGAALWAAPVAAQPGRAARAADELALGRSLATRNCGPCHAVGRADVSPRAGAPAFRDLSQRYPVEALGEALAEGILTGHPQMPEFRFKPHEVNAILRYLESIQARRQGRMGGPAPSIALGDRKPSVAASRRATGGVS